MSRLIERSIARGPQPEGQNPPPISFANWHLGQHHGQDDYVLYALKPDTYEPSRENLLGMVTYSVFRTDLANEVHISMIAVPDRLRRQGIGTALWRELERLWPGHQFPRGMATPEGAALRKSVGRTHGNNPPPTCDPSRTPHPTVKAKPGDRVRVHRNLHNGCWVISKQGKVVGYARNVSLKNVTPKIGMAGYTRCRADQTRNVHAYLEGDLVSAKAKPPTGDGWKSITYNCKVGPGPFFFYERGGKAFEGAAQAVLSQQGGKVRVKVKGKASRTNPPTCPCTLPGGACTCGRIDAEQVQEDGPSCNDVGGLEGVVLVPAGPGRALLDVGAVRRVDPAKFWEESCPCVLAYQGPGGEAARRGWEGQIDQHRLNVAALAWVSSRVGGLVDQVSLHLYRNGEGWCAHERARA